MSEKHIGSNLDDFWAVEGLLAQAESVAVKRVIAFKINQYMEQQNLSNNTWLNVCTPAAPRWNDCLILRISP